MAQAYVGLVRWAEGVPTPADVDQLRSKGQEAFSDLLEKVRALPANLPATCRLEAAYTVGAQDLISFMVVEAESLADLQLIDNYYQGWLQLEWHPTQLVERD